jgi:hypothetical protein
MGGQELHSSAVLYILVTISGANDNPASTSKHNVSYTLRTAKIYKKEKIRYLF